MRQFDATLNLDFLRYVDRASPLHRLHPGSKLLLLAALFAACIVTPDASTLLVLFAIVNVLVALARVPFGPHYRTLLRALPLLVIVVALQILTVPAYHWGSRLGHPPFSLYSGELVAAVTSLLRFADLIVTMSLIASVTRVTELSSAAESLASPLALVGLRPRTFALTVRIALYFLPLFGIEATRILKSQASRGADFATRGLVRRVRAYLPLFVPLIVLALRHAESLARAMEARCYTVGGKPTRYRSYAIAARDALLLAGAAVVVAIAFVNPLDFIDRSVRSLLL